MRVPTYDRAAVAPAAMPGVRVDDSAGQTLARSLGNFGEAVDRYGLEMDQAAVRELGLELSAFERETLYGQNGFSRLNGSAAVEASPQVSANVEAKVRELKSRLKPGRRLEMFSEFADHWQAQTLGAVARHASAQEAVYRDGAVSAQAEQASDLFVAAFGSGDHEAIGQKLTGLAASLEDLGRLRGWSDEQRQQAFEQQYSTAVRVGVSGLLEEGRIDDARAMFKRYGAAMDSEVRVLVEGDLRQTSARLDREAREQAEASRHDLMTAVENDVGSVRLSGKGAAISREEFAQRGGTQDEYAKYLQGRAEAIAHYERFGDLSSLPPEEASRRIFESSQADFPAINQEQDFDAVIAAMAHVETAGNSRQVSEDGAVGKLQLLPATARAAAKRIGVAFDEKRLLNDDAYNEQLGREQMRYLLDYYDGDSLLAVTAYHAGEGNVDGWLKKYGDPRSGGVSRGAWLAQVGAKNPRSAAYPQKVMRALGAGVNAAAWDALDGADRLRRDDPAAAVAMRKDVQMAVASWQQDAHAGNHSTGSGERAVGAFLRGQELAGIKEKDRRSLPLASLAHYAAGAVELMGADDAEGLRKFERDLTRQFGRHGQKVLEDVYRVAGAGEYAAQVSAALTYKRQHGKPITPQDQQAAARAQKLETARAAATGAPPAPIRVASKAEYDRLRPGARYIAPDGSVRTKGAG